MKRWSVLGLLLFLAILRLVWIEADIPEMTPGGWGRSYLTDEGRKAHNARNLVLFGKLVTDDFNQGYLTTPAYFACVYPVFRLFGVGLVQQRVLSAVLGLLAVLIASRITAGERGEKAGILVAAVLGLNFPFLMFSRLGTYETAIILSMVLSGYLWCRGESNAWLSFASGFTAFLPFLVRPTGLVFVPILYAAFALRRISRRCADWRNLGAFSAGLAMVVLLWLAWLFVPDDSNAREFRRVMDYSIPTGAVAVTPLSLGASLIASLRNKNFTFLFQYMPLMTLIAYGASYAVGARILRERESLRNGELLSIAWLVVGTVFSLVVQFQHVHYFLFLVPPMAWLAADVVWTGIASPPASPRHLWWMAGLYLWLLPAVYVVTYGTIETAIRGSPTLLPTNVLSLLIAAALCASSLVLWRLGRTRASWTAAAPRFLPIFARAAGVWLVAFPLVLYARWACTRTYDLVTASQSIQRLIGDQATLCGDAAHTLVMSSRAKATVGHNRLSTRDACERFGAIHVVLQTEFLAETNEFRDGMTLIPISNLYVRGEELHLFRIEASPVPKGESVDPQR